jgi:hypothetical protein
VFTQSCCLCAASKGYSILASNQKAMNVRVISFRNDDELEVIKRNIGICADIAWRDGNKRLYNELVEELYQFDERLAKQKLYSIQSK